MSNRLQHLCCAIFLCLLISSCQSDKETSPPQPSMQKQAPVPAQVPSQVQTNKPQKAPVPYDVKEEKPALPAVNLDLSQEMLEKIDDNSQQELTAELQKKTEIETVEQRKVKISGGALIDKNEEDLTKKVDGGKINISVPFN